MSGIILGCMDPREEMDLALESGIDLSAEVELLDAWIDLQEYLVFYNLFWDSEFLEIQR